MTPPKQTVARTPRPWGLLAASCNLALLSSACPEWTDPFVCVGDCRTPDEFADGNTEAMVDSAGNTVDGDTSDLQDTGSSTEGGRPPTYDPSCGDASKQSGELCLDPAAWFVEPQLPSGSSAVIAARGPDHDRDVVFFQSRNKSLELDYLSFEWNEQHVDSKLNWACPIEDTIEAIARIDSEGPMQPSLIGRSNELVWVMPHRSADECTPQVAYYPLPDTRVEMGLPPFSYLTNDALPEYRFGAWSWSDNRVRYDWAESIFDDSSDIPNVTQFIVSPVIDTGSAERWASGDLMAALGPELVGIHRDTLVIGYGFPSDPQATTVSPPPNLRVRDHELVGLEVAELDGRTPMDLVVLSSEGHGLASWLTYLFLERHDPESAPTIAQSFELELPPDAHRVQTGHLNADEIPDVLVLHRESNLASLAISVEREADLRPLQIDPRIQTQAVVLGDLNGDGATDLILLGYEGQFSGVLPALP